MYMEALKAKKIIFVTVGSTSFPELISAVVQPKCLETMVGNGYTNLVIQHGA